MPIIQCSRCKQEKDAIQKTAFYRGEVKTKLLAHACDDCWKEWLKMQAMLINEYRLDLMSPKTDEFLNKQVLGFFGLDSDAEIAGVNYVPPEHT